MQELGNVRDEGSKTWEMQDEGKQELGITGVSDPPHPGGLGWGCCWDTGMLRLGWGQEASGQEDTQDKVMEMWG